MRALATWLGVLGIATIAAALTFEWAERSGYERLDARSLQQLDLYAAGIESELKRYEYVPSMVELDPSVLALLMWPANARLRDSANHSLARLGVRAGVSAVFVLDAAGTVVASSDWYLPATLLGGSFAEVPLYREALQSGYGRAFSAAFDNRAASYYFAQLLRHEGRVLGAAVIQITLEALESTWIEITTPTEAERLLVLDENGVVILSSVRAWKYRAWNDQPGPQRARLAQSGRYPKRSSFEPLGLSVVRRLPHNGVVLRLPPTDTDDHPSFGFLHEKPMVRTGWRLMLLSDSAAVEATARAFAVAAAALSGLLLLYLLQRRRQQADRQRAHDELEQRVAERTAELVQSNTELMHEISERERTEGILREAQDELVQAGKLAMLGQMSASITHEINQPLTALGVLADNARLLLQRSRIDEAGKNLILIRELIDRMGRITAQLKTFARKAAAAEESVPLSRAVANALLLMENRISVQGTQLHVEVPGTLCAQCDPTRLEQVLVNLIANALDAMRHWNGPQCLAIHAWPHDSRVIVRVEDSGPGIPDDAMPHLFEPFFSTKPAGEGLGLGLVISASIIREFGGVLRGLNHGAGAAFEFDLKLSEEACHA